ncbi:hypothetical protein NPIL_497881 [Nephila pilipes]|uniref:DUF985 domain-containing protein n=1 Tax=Nephila pilipes TaxID=299642 RepID=A0A8X6N7E6_NEPPI|nr:hypothetical protein NPIL_497881 [Nephila pilipes]
MHFLNESKGVRIQGTISVEPCSMIIDTGVFIEFCEGTLKGIPTHSQRRNCWQNNCVTSSQDCMKWVPHPLPVFLSLLKNNLITTFQTNFKIKWLTKQLDDCIDVTQKTKIGDLINRLETVILDTKALFLTEEIGLTNWNNNKAYLKEVLSSLKQLSNQNLTKDDIISYLKLNPLNACTSEQGYFKEFARGVNQEGKIFTCIFYLLRDNEISYFHKLYNTKRPERSPTEKFIWLAGSPLSIFAIKGDQLTVEVIDDVNKETTNRSGTWFGALITKEYGNTTEALKDKFSLVICECIPAFTRNCYHDLTDEHKTAWYSLINIYQNSAKDKRELIEKLLLSKEKEKFIKTCLEQSVSSDIPHQESKQFS